MVFREVRLPSRSSLLLLKSEYTRSPFIHYVSIWVFESLKLTFYIILILFLGLLVAFILVSSVPVSIKLPGIIRPSSERTDLVCLTTGFIDTIYVKEGELVKEYQPIVSLKNIEWETRMDQLNYEIRQSLSDIRDLEILCNKQLTVTDIKRISNPALRQQLSRYAFRMKELDLLSSKSENEFKVAEQLFINKVIASKEFSDEEFEYQLRLAEAETAKNDQRILWYQELLEKKKELNALESQFKLDQANEEWLLVRAPVSGAVQGIRSIYKGSAMQAGQIIGNVSPEAELIVECYAGPGNVGLLKEEHFCRFQVDAFNYKYFGWLEGKVLSIDNDFTLLDNRPAYKIRCSINQPLLLLNNGYVGNLKKGMTVQARFTLAERKLWQLLWDKLDDWLNPLAGGQPLPRTRQ